MFQMRSQVPELSEQNVVAVVAVGAVVVFIVFFNAALQNAEALQTNGLDCDFLLSSSLSSFDRFALAADRSLMLCEYDSSSSSSGSTPNSTLVSSFLSTTCSAIPSAIEIFPPQPQPASPDWISRLTLNLGIKSINVGRLVVVVVVIPTVASSLLSQSSADGSAPTIGADVGGALVRDITWSLTFPTT